jgi:hypothetical protein
MQAAKRTHEHSGSFLRRRRIIGMIAIAARENIIGSGTLDSKVTEANLKSSGNLRRTPTCQAIRITLNGSERIQQGIRNERKVRSRRSIEEAFGRWDNKVLSVQRVF